MTTKPDQVAIPTEQESTAMKQDFKSFWQEHGATDRLSPELQALADKNPLEHNEALQEFNCDRLPETEIRVDCHFSYSDRDMAFIGFHVQSVEDHENGEAATEDDFAQLAVDHHNEERLQDIAYAVCVAINNSAPTSLHSAIETGLEYLKGIEGAESISKSFRSAQAKLSHQTGLHYPSGFKIGRRATMAGSRAVGTIVAIGERNGEQTVTLEFDEPQPVDEPEGETSRLFELGWRKITSTWAATAAEKPVQGVPTPYSQSIRAKALALLAQAQAIDNLKPFLVIHEHRHGTAGYVAWFDRTPNETEAASILNTSFEPDREVLTIEENITLEELTGAGLSPQT